MTTDNKVQFDDAKLSYGDNLSITITTLTTPTSTLLYSQSNNARTNNSSFALTSGTISFNSTTNN